MLGWARYAPASTQPPPVAEYPWIYNPPTQPPSVAVSLYTTITLTVPGYLRTCHPPSHPFWQSFYVLPNSNIFLEKNILWQLLSLPPQSRSTTATPKDCLQDQFVSSVNDTNICSVANYLRPINNGKTN